MQSRLHSTVIDRVEIRKEGQFYFITIDLLKVFCCYWLVEATTDLRAEVYLIEAGGILAEASINAA